MDTPSVVSKIREINLVRNPSEALGIELVRGDNTTENIPGIYIRAISEGSAASKVNICSYCLLVYLLFNNVFVICYISLGLSFINQRTSNVTVCYKLKRTFFNLKFNQICPKIDLFSDSKILKKFWAFLS